MEVPELKKHNIPNTSKAFFESDSISAGSDFSHSNLRGLNLTRTNFQNAVFVGAEGGLTNSWFVGLSLLVFVLCLLAGLISGYSGAIISNLLFGHDSSSFFGVIALVTLIICLATTLRKGLGLSLAILVECIAAALIATMAIVPNSYGHLGADSLFTVSAIAGSIVGVINAAIGTALARLINVMIPRIFVALLTFGGVVLGVLLGSDEEIGYPISLFTGVLSIVIG